MSWAFSMFVMRSVKLPFFFCLICGSRFFCSNSLQIYIQQSEVTFSTLLIRILQGDHTLHKHKSGVNFNIFPRANKVWRADGRLVNMSGVFCTNNAQARLLVSVTLEKREGACALFVQKISKSFQKKIKELRPKMNKITSRGSCTGHSLQAPFGSPGNDYDNKNKRSKVCWFLGFFFEILSDLNQAVSQSPRRRESNALARYISGPFFKMVLWRWSSGVSGQGVVQAFDSRLRGD